MFRNWLNNNRVEDFDFSAPLFPKAREREYWENEYSKKYVEVAEEYLCYDWPSIKATDYIAFKTESSRVKQENVHFARRSALYALILGELAEYKGRFIPQIVNGIFTTCEETYWGVSAHFPPANYRHNIPQSDDGYIDLFSAETASALALVYYVLYDELYNYCPEILTRIEYEIHRRVIKSYLAHRDWFWQGYTIPINNWNPWIISNLLTVFLIMEKSKTVRDEGIRKMLFEIDNIYQSYPEDGGCDEGISYWAVSGGAVCEFCEQLYTATQGKINFFDDEKLKNVAKYPVRVYIGNGYVTNYADGGNRMAGGSKQLIDCYIYGKRMKDDLLLSFAGELTNDDLNDKDSYKFSSYLRTALYKIVNIKDILSHKGFTPDEGFVLPDLQNSFVRKNKWFYSCKGGNNAERHNHNDVGSFIAYYDNSPVLVDPGCGVYTARTFHGDRYGIWTMQSGWHNTPVINGCMQKNGAEYKADDFSLSEKSTNVRFAKAYGSEAGITDLDRNVTITETGVEICDTFRFSNEQNKVCEHFVTPLSVEITEEGAVIGGRFLLISDGGTFKTDYADFEGDRNLTKYWETDRMNRIIIESDVGGTSQIRITLRQRSSNRTRLKHHNFGTF